VAIYDVREGYFVCELIAGAPVQIWLTADRQSLRADGQGVSVITVKAFGAHRQPHPNADHPVTFSLKSPGAPGENQALKCPRVKPQSPPFLQDMDDKTNRPSAAAISVSGLCKRYGASEAVCELSFEVGVGQIFALVGPNGAGKTTTLECILGLRQPDAGSIRIHGLDLRTHANQATLLVGAQLQAATLQDKITPRQALDLFGSFYSRRFPGDELLRRVDLEDKANAPFDTLSGGQRQRLFLALALVNRPALLVLDEPTAGLDPQARRKLRILIQEMRAEGRTVLLSTHDLEEACQLCDQVAIMDGGRLIAVAPPAELIARSTSLSRVCVRTAPPLTRALVDSLPHMLGAVYSDCWWVMNTTAPNLLLADLVRQVDESAAELLDVQLRRPSLEDVFIELTGHSWTGGESPGELS